MKKKMALIISFLLIFSTCLTTSYGLSDTSNINLKKIGNGCYEIVPNRATYNSDLIVSSEDSQIYTSTDKKTTLLKVNETVFQEVSEIKINPYDIDSLNKTIEKYKISKVLADSLRNYISKCNNKEIANPKDISYYTPTIDPRGTSYVGFKGKTYFDEVVKYSNTSDPSEIIAKSSGWNNYWNTALKESATAQSSSHYYGNYIVVPGKPNSKTCFTSTVTETTKNYSTLDSKAYYSYTSSPYTEYIDGFQLHNKYFKSI